jgi:hypothetical protein
MVERRSRRATRFHQKFKLLQLQVSIVRPKTTAAARPKPMVGRLPRNTEQRAPMNQPSQMDKMARRRRLMGWVLRTAVLHASTRKMIIPTRKDPAQEIHLNFSTLWLKSSSENARTKAKMMAN